MVNNINCKYSKICGSCQLLGKTYQETLTSKLFYVNECLKKNGFTDKVTKIIGSSNNISYRNKMILGYKYVNGKIISGFYEESSHRIVDIDSCLMHSDTQNTIAKAIKTILQELKLRPYDEDKKTGLIRYVLIREAIFTEEVLVVIITSTDIFPARSEVVKRIKNISPKIKTIIQNINPRKTSIVLGEKERILFGNGYITDKFNDLMFNITSKSFYQVNSHQTKVLYEEVRRLASFNGSERIVDAYSGVGTIGMILSSGVKEVISVENNKQAVMAAIANAKINGIKNVNFVCDDATNYLVNLAKEKVNLDAIIMDPPRTGSTIAFLDAVNKIRPNKVVYVSCDPETLARDLKELKKYYYIKDIECVDMFCWTKHVETVVLLLKK